jgi:long-chain acyl-CoA synthetase
LPTSQSIERAPFGSSVKPMAREDQEIYNSRSFFACRYDELEYVTARTLLTLQVKDYLLHSSAQFRYIGERVQNLRQTCGALEPRTSALDQLAVIAALTILVQNSDQILRGSVDGMQCIRRKPGLWKRMMCDWPMGDYGRVLAEYINDHRLARGKILELGAGVGHASKFIKPEPGAIYIKTDRIKMILQMYNAGNIIEEYDIDQRHTPFRDLDLVFASNVLHCAADKERTLRNIYGMLRPGSSLVFSEGVPEVTPNREWCLAPLFGFFDDWWDKGGFISAARWSEYLATVGFTTVAKQEMFCGPYRLGILFVAQKAAHGLSN